VVYFYRKRFVSVIHDQHTDHPDLTQTPGPYRAGDHEWQPASMATITREQARVAAETADLPLVLTLEEAAAIARRAPGTLKRLVSEGRFPKSAKRGKPLLFWRDAFLIELMRDNDA